MKNLETILLVAAFLSAITPGAAVACPIAKYDKTTFIPSRIYDIVMSTVPAEIKVGELFSVQMEICRKDGSAFDGDIKASATMPAHKHGMNYKPEVVSVTDGLFILEGFAFHMQGQWKFAFDLVENGEAETVSLDYKLK